MNTYDNRTDIVQTDYTDIFYHISCKNSLGWGSCQFTSFLTPPQGILVDGFVMLNCP